MKSIEPTYAFIADFIADKHYPPSVREVSQGTGLKYTTAYSHILRLQARGWIKRDKGRMRTMRVVRVKQ